MVQTPAWSVQLGIGKLRPANASWNISGWSIWLLHCLDVYFWRCWPISLNFTGALPPTWSAWIVGWVPGRSRNIETRTASCGRCLRIFVVLKWVDQASCSISTSWQSFLSRTGSPSTAQTTNGDLWGHPAGWLSTTSAHQTSLSYFVFQITYQPLFKTTTWTT